MMIDPPIDKLIKKAPCRYALVVALTKRTNEIIESEPAEYLASGLKPVSYVAREIYNDKVKIIL
ncbi:MAG: DNA-directed RNA polymerase subunit omega [Christensenellales bacterium]|jgi:DNA-directed RNA polymerase omega subunit|nr:DNA-directed RNA polymerase subunit omega [Clostridiales bacterium]